MISKDELTKIVGSENVSDAQADLLKYSSDHSLVPPGMPEYVVWPTSSEQLAKFFNGPIKTTSLLFPYLPRNTSTAAPCRSRAASSWTFRR